MRTHPKILLVEDDETLAAPLQSELELKGYAVRTANPNQRSVGVSLTSTIEAFDGRAIDKVRAYGDRVASQFPESVLSIVEPAILRISSVRMVVADPPSYETRLSLRYQDGVTDAARIVAGRWPEDRGVALEIGYTGSKGTHLGKLRDINYPRRTEQAYMAGTPIQDLRPYRFYNGAINFFTYVSNSFYSAGQVSLRRRGRRS